MRVQLAAVVIAAMSLAAAGASAQTVQPAPERSTTQTLVAEPDDSQSVAAASGVRAITLIALALLKEFEGWVPKPYDDPADYCTIGHGHLIALAPCATLDPLPYADGISDAEGEKLLDADTLISRRDVARLVTVELSDAQFSALASFVFNVGGPKFEKSTLLELLNAGEADLAADQFSRWVKAGGEVKAGLVARRACERALFLEALQLSPAGTFDRRLCESRGIVPSAEDLIDIEIGE